MNLFLTLILFSVANSATARFFTFSQPKNEPRMFIFPADDQADFQADYQDILALSGHILKERGIILEYEEAPEKQAFLATLRPALFMTYAYSSAKVSMVLELISEIMHHFGWSGQIGIQKIKASIINHLVTMNVVEYPGPTEISSDGQSIFLQRFLPIDFDTMGPEEIRSAMNYFEVTEPGGTRFFIKGDRAIEQSDEDGGFFKIQTEGKEVDVIFGKLDIKFGDLDAFPYSSLTPLRYQNPNLPVYDPLNDGLYYPPQVASTIMRKIRFHIMEL